MLRVESGRAGLLITLLVNPDIDQVSSETSMRVASVDEAMLQVRRFLSALGTYSVDGTDTGLDRE